MYTIQQYNELKAAISQGVTRVKHQDKEVNYRSIDEMLRIKKLMELELFPSTTKKGLGSKLYVTTKKGI